MNPPAAHRNLVYYLIWCFERTDDGATPMRSPTSPSGKPHARRPTTKEDGPSPRSVVGDRIAPVRSFGTGESFARCKEDDESEEQESSDDHEGELHVLAPQGPA